MTDTRTPYDDVKYHCSHAAQAITALSYKEWHPWAMYFLELLDQEMFLQQEVPGLRLNVLESLQKDLAQRLETGSW